MPDLAYLDELNTAMARVQNACDGVPLPMNAVDDYVVVSANKDSDPTMAERWLNQLQTDGFVLASGDSTNALLRDEVDRAQVNLVDSNNYVVMKIWLK